MDPSGTSTSSCSYHQGITAHLREIDLPIGTWMETFGVTQIGAFPFGHFVSRYIANGECLRWSYKTHYGATLGRYP